MEEPERPITLRLPIEWFIPPDIKSVYATNLLIQRGDHEFFISLFELRPPIVIGTPEQQREQAAQLHTARAECVARIIVGRDRLPEFVQVLQDFINMEPTEAVDQEPESEETDAPSDD